MRPFVHVVSETNDILAFKRRIQGILDGINATKGALLIRIELSTCAVNVSDVEYTALIVWEEPHEVD